MTRTTDSNSNIPSGELAAVKEATDHTVKANAAILKELPIEDRRSFENAKRGFLASLDSVTITNKDGRKIYDLSDLAFLKGEAPQTANPSLWRQAQLNALYHGLFEVVDGIYQIRSFDLANMTIIRGETGWIVIDPLASAEASKTALELANTHLGERPVVAVIITHSHPDHYLGILGVVDAKDVAGGKVVVVAPQHFVKETVSESVLAGTAMQRRAIYMYGLRLPHSPQGFISNGLGAEISRGTVGFIVPTDIVKETGETRVIDGIEIEFQMTPDSEAVSEFVFYFPQFKALCMSEITSHHLHNIYTPRGAQTRDALAWANQINESIELFGDRLEVQFASHHWPTWGREAAVDYLKTQRDLYKYIHDQTLRLANHGYTRDEIAEQLRLPDSLAKNFSNRDYYGTVSHNVKAVYTKYLGYFDGNPANLNPLPPAAAGSRYVEYMGGAEAIMTKARDSFDKGEYRWVAQVMNHVVMAEPDNAKARAFLADTYEQLGYQSESGPWRNFYLSGALELRQGVPDIPPGVMNAGTLKGIPIENVFQALAVRLNGPKAAEKRFAFNLDFTDIGKTYLMTVDNAVLNSFEDAQSPNPNAKLSMSSLDFKFMMLGHTKAENLMADGKLTLEGDATAFAEFAGLFDQFKRLFPIVTPRDM
ncbi:MAG: MBL fold metallo-hydrolase [Deltaproteobacteria bacterium]|nr:MBL fold metallo-hydrolase [Deltaproteobacteria bacterium]MBW2050912.1 MBL fold metallo-hydrolase [Deltaproteobacteria bacterium]